MSKKRIKAVIVAVLLALILSVGAPSPVSPSTVLAGVCGVTASGCH